MDHLDSSLEQLSFFMPARFVAWRGPWDMRTSDELTVPGDAETRVNLAFSLTFNVFSGSQPEEEIEHSQHA
jgi:hypothetical protein